LNFHFPSAAAGRRAGNRTVNGVEAHGGSIDGPGMVAVGGMLYATSGNVARGGAG